MTASHLALSGDLPPWAVVVTASLAALTTTLLLLEPKRRDGAALRVVVTGVLAAAALVLAVLRPVRIAATESIVGARVTILVDTSRSMTLPDGEQAREAKRDDVMTRLTSALRDARVETVGFDDGPPHALVVDEAGRAPSLGRRSDLATALRAIGSSTTERPRAIVVVSDGRLDDPQADATPEALAALVSSVGVPVHAVATTREPPPDASIRNVRNAGAAVAHVPFTLHVEVGCEGPIDCEALTVDARELREDGPPALLASGTVHVKGGVGSIDLTVALERAGDRILDLGLAVPSGDRVPENNRRLITFHVARERVRVLHVAGRPTVDVRALRDWLKSDASVDVVAFFILRTPTDDTRTESASELALIPFPVDELFSEHLSSFDAVVLQDFDAQPYGLEKHLPALARYVRDGGGLIMVGGPNSFVGGGYADSALGNAGGVLPVRLDGAASATASDVAAFDPTWTENGRLAPLLGPLRAIVGDELPSMPGANVLGDARANSVVLWAHPTRKTPSGRPMPVLAIGEEGDGRTIALGVDGAWRLAFSALGTRTAGRGYGALWDGLLGWLMRDPRFEPARVEVVGGCTARVPATLRVHLPDASGTPGAVDVTALSEGGRPGTIVHRVLPAVASQTVEVALPPLEPGGYVARLQVRGKGSTRSEFVCEVGSDEWADSRPDGARLRALAKASGGAFLWADDEMSVVRAPRPTTVSTERHVVPVAPPWVWSMLATVLLGAHWVTRRRSGLS